MGEDRPHLSTQRLIFQRLHQCWRIKLLPGFGARLPGSNQTRRVRIDPPLRRAARVLFRGARKEQAALFGPNVPALFLLQLERIGSLLLLGLTTAHTEQGREGYRACVKRAAIDRVPTVRGSCRLCHTCFLVAIKVGAVTASASVAATARRVKNPALLPPTRYTP